MKVRFSSIAIAACLLIAVMSAQADNKNLNIQGRLTDGAGDPIADGVHSLDFSLWDSPVGGSNVWSEPGVGVSTTDGLFSTQIGTLGTIPPWIFDSYESLWLEIVVDGETMTPRTYLASAAHARTAESVQGFSQSFGAKTFDMYSDYPQLSMYGADGLSQALLWGDSWGEIFLYDETVSNYLEVVLTTNGNDGSLYLRENGATRIALEAGSAGDNSVVVPTGAINADEMLNEPGITSANGISFFAMGAVGNYTVDSVVISAPTAGYVTVMCSGYFWAEHVNGTLSEAIATLESDKTASLIPGISAIYVPSAEPSGSRAQALSCLNVFSVSAGTNKFFLNANKFNGGGTIYVARPKIVAMFTPTPYGAVELAPIISDDPATSSPAGNNGGNEGTFETITVEQHEAMLAAQRREIESQFEERLRKLEESVAKGRQTDTEASNR